MPSTSYSIETTNRFCGKIFSGVIRIIMTNNEVLTVNFGQLYFSNKRLNVLDKIIDILFAISLLLIGADRWSFQVLDVNIRINQFILILCFIFMLINGKNKIKKCVPMLFFLISSFLSTIFSFSFFRSALFYFSILYNVVFIFYLFSCYIYYYGLKKFMSLFRVTSYVLFSLLLLQAIAFVLFNFKIPFFPAYYNRYYGIPRVSLWFYEPSYLSTYLVFWLSIAMYNVLINANKSFIKDVIMCLLMFALASSTTGYLGFFGVFFVTFLVSLRKGFSWKKFILLIVFIAAIVAAVIVFKDSLNVFLSRIFKYDLDTASGGRVTTMKQGIDVWLGYNPFLGVGPGCYGIYIANDPSQVTNNLSTDLLSSLGILGLITFYSLHIWLIIKGIKIYKKTKNQYLPAMLIGLVFFIILLQANNGYLRLYHWMFLGIIFGTINYLNVEQQIDYSIRFSLIT